jgi:hypothetical protein
VRFIASQVSNARSAVAVGGYLKVRVFAPDRTLDWNGLTRHATGEVLNAKAFAAKIARE